MKKQGFRWSLKHFFWFFKRHPPRMEVPLLVITICLYISDGVSTKMHQNNVFTVAKRTLEGQDMVYQSIKFTNNVWALCELKLSPDSDVISVSKKIWKKLICKCNHTWILIRNWILLCSQKNFGLQPRKKTFERWKVRTILETECFLNLLLKVLIRTLQQIIEM